MKDNLKHIHWPPLLVKEYIAVERTALKFMVLIKRKCNGFKSEKGYRKVSHEFNVLKKEAQRKKEIRTPEVEGGVYGKE